MGLELGNTHNRHAGVKEAEPLPSRSTQAGGQRPACKKLWGGTEPGACFGARWWEWEPCVLMLLRGDWVHPLSSPASVSLSAKWGSCGFAGRDR